MLQSVGRAPSSMPANISRKSFSSSSSSSYASSAPPCASSCLAAGNKGSDYIKGKPRTWLSTLNEVEKQTFSRSFSNLTSYLCSPAAHTITPNNRCRTRRLRPRGFANNSPYRPETLTPDERLLASLRCSFLANFLNLQCKNRHLIDCRIVVNKANRCF
jgi:hypothetical protein